MPTCFNAATSNSVNEEFGDGYENIFMDKALEPTDAELLRKIERAELGGQKGGDSELSIPHPAYRICPLMPHCLPWSDGQEMLTMICFPVIEAIIVAMGMMQDMVNSKARKTFHIVIATDARCCATKILPKPARTIPLSPSEFIFLSALEFCL